MTDLLLDTSLDSIQRECAETIRFSGQALLTVLSDILDFSKIEAGKLTLECIGFNVVSTMQEAIRMLSPAAAAKGLLLNFDVAEGIPATVFGDPTRFRQVVLNLLANAIKFTSSGSIQVRLRGQQLDGGRPGLYIEVTDTGVGIARETQDKLFTRFTQADSSMARKFGGTGLGLAITRRLVELMNGSIGVRSELGRGSTFYFTIEYAEEAAAA
jgi:signal transduction histidine kinase